MRRSQVGLTLMELLVVLSLVSMLSVVLLQGTMLLFGNYQRVLAVQARITQERLPTAWFRASVSGMLASLDHEFAFSGDAQAFSGYTIAPVLSPAGALTRVHWAVKTEGDHQVLVLVEGHIEPLTIKKWRAEHAELEYIDEAGRVFSDWSPQAQGGLNPRAVRLQIIAQGVVLERFLVALQSRSDGIADYRDLL
jgi:general secretion pathway protein J